MTFGCTASRKKSSERKSGSISLQDTIKGLPELKTLQGDIYPPVEITGGTSITKRTELAESEYGLMHSTVTDESENQINHYNIK